MAEILDNSEALTDGIGIKVEYAPRVVVTSIEGAPEAGSPVFRISHGRWVLMTDEKVRDLPAVLALAGFKTTDVEAGIVTASENGTVRITTAGPVPFKAPAPELAAFMGRVSFADR